MRSYDYEVLNGEAISWGPHHAWARNDDEPCNGYGFDPAYRLRFLQRLQVKAWQPMYDIIVLGNIGDIRLVDGDWRCEITSSGLIHHGVVAGPLKNPEDFISLVELYLSAMQSTRISIPWLGVHREGRMRHRSYDTDDPVYVRSVPDGVRSKHMQHIHGFREYMDKPPEEYFSLFCSAMRHEKRLWEIILEWMMIKRWTYARPTLIDGYRTLRTVVLLDHDNSENDQHKLMRQTIPQWPIPSATAQWMTKNKHTSQHWYDAVRILRNKAEHREYLDIDRDMATAMSEMSHDVVNRLCWLIWHKITSRKQFR